MSALIIYGFFYGLINYARMIDVTTWSQQFDAFARFVKEN